MAKKEKLNPEKQQVPTKRKKDLGDVLLWVWVVMLCLAGIFMAYKFITA